MKILISYFTQTGNTEKVARAIYDEVSSQEHEAHLKRIKEIAVDSLNDYDLIFIGSTCHSADLANPVKQILQEVAESPKFKLAGFATHATHTPEGGKREQELYKRWASKCIVSFNKASQEKQIDFLGYFNCQGAPSAPIEAFIHNEIIIDEDEWKEYIAEVRKHPDTEDLQQAKEFARQVLAKCKEEKL